MSREELKEIIQEVIARLKEPAGSDDTPRPACIFGDCPEPDPCDGVTTFYGIGEEG